jgi:carboxypeptidase Taq
MQAMRALRERLAELADLDAIEMLLSWDQLVMMPSEGAPARAAQLGTLARLSHERARAEEIGEWLSQLAGTELEELDRDVVRLAQRDWERAHRVPDELAAELARASTDGQESWVAARAHDDFAAFAPALERNVRLAREYAQCVVGPGQGAYEALLCDYDFGLTTAELRRLFGRLAELLPPLVAEASVRTPRRRLDIPVAAQELAVAGIMRRLGVEAASWRVDVSAHPFTAWVGQHDSRVTTR